MRVLFVDDEKDFRESYTELMETWGFDVIPFADQASAEAWITANADAVDLAIIDLKLDNSRDDAGIDVVRRLSQCNPSAVTIVLSAFMPSTCMEAGAFTYLSKGPATSALVREAMKRAVWERICRLNVRLDYCLLEWWIARGEHLFGELFAKEKPTLAADQSLILRDIVKARVTTVIPSLEAPVVSIRSLFSAKEQALPIEVVEVASDAQVRTHLLAFPDLTPLLKYFTHNGLKGERIALTVRRRGDIVRVVLRFIGFILPFSCIRELNLCFARPFPTLDHQLQLASLSLRLTGLGAVVWVAPDGRDTTVTFSMPMAEITKRS